MPTPVARNLPGFNAPRLEASQYTPAVDPQFLAFQRQLNQDESDAYGDASRRKSALSSVYARQLPQWDMAEEKGLRNVGDDFAARGVFSSGIRVQRQNEVGREFQMLRDNAAADQARGLSDVDYDLARRVALLRRQGTESGLVGSQNAVLDPLKSWAQAYGV